MPSGLKGKIDPVTELEGYDRAWEQGNTTTDFEQLTKAGVDLPPPDDLTDKELTAKLWEVINGLAKMRTFLDNTDHLSDRELYAHLWEHSLRREIVPVLPEGNTIVHLNILGGCSERDIYNYLKYYADEREREWWAQDCPDYEIPDHEDPPYDRDRHLP